jgi:hypothetical protein
MPEVQQVQEPSKTVVLTSENSAAFYAKRLDIAPEEVQKPAEEQKPEVKEEEQKEEPKEEVKAEEKVEEKPKPELTKSQKRIMEMAEKVKAAEAKAAAAEARAKELEAKAAPAPEADDGKPDPAKYTDAFKYAEDLAKWTTKNELAAREKTDKEEKAKAQRQTVVNAWQQRQAEYLKDNPDFAEAITDVMLTPVMSETILESELGPQILHHLHQNPEQAAKIREMTPTAAARAMGRIEERLEKPPAKAEVKPEPKAEISRAPEPPSPLGTGKSVEALPFNSQGEFTGTPAQWKALRRAGKIH